MQRKKDKRIPVSKKPNLKKKFEDKEKLRKVGAKKSPAAMKKAPVKKALIGKQANLPKALRDKIMASPATMLKPAAMKMMKKAPVGPTVDIRKKKNSFKVAENKRQLDSKYNGPRSKGGLSPRKIGSKK